MTWGGCRDKEEWADVHGYVRIHCKIHGQSWSDGEICEACFSDGRLDESDEEDKPIMCNGCGDVVVEDAADFCSDCQEENRLAGMYEDPKKSHGRPSNA